MSLNRGIFLEFVSYLAENGDHILANHLQEASSNATYLSQRIQNEMIEIVDHEVGIEIVRLVKKSGVFAVLMDETTDVSHKEQVVIFVRYVLTTENIAIAERMVALVDTNVTTGEGLAKSLVNALTFHGLDVCNIVGRGYDGGSNMRGAQQGVQARSKRSTPWRCLCTALRIT